MLDIEEKFRVSGDLGEYPFPCVLQQLHERTVTGRIVLVRGEISKEVFMVEGAPVNVKSNLRDETLGRYLVKTGKVTEEDYEKSIELMIKENIQQGAALVKLGSISARDLYHEVKAQTREKLLSCFAWTTGTFSFVPEVDFVEDIYRFEMSTPRIMHDGIMRFFPYGAIEKQLIKVKNGPILPVAGFFNIIGEYGLDENESSFVMSIDGQKDLKELKKQEALYPGAPKLLYLLLACGLAGPAGEISREVRSIGVPDFRMPPVEDVIKYSVHDTSPEVVEAVEIDDEDTGESEAPAMEGGPFKTVLDDYTRSDDPLADEDMFGDEGIEDEPDAGLAEDAGETDIEEESVEIGIGGATPDFSEDGFGAGDSSAITDARPESDDDDIVDIPAFGSGDDALQSRADDLAADDPGLPADPAGPEAGGPEPGDTDAAPEPSDWREEREMAALEGGASDWREGRSPDEVTDVESGFFKSGGDDEDFEADLGGEEEEIEVGTRGTAAADIAEESGEEFRDESDILEYYMGIKDADFFALLGVGRDAGDDEVRAAYRRIRAEYDIDRFGPGISGEAADKLEEINARIIRAYEALRTADSRKSYLESIEAKPEPRKMEDSLKAEQLLQKGMGHVRKREWALAQEMFEKAAEASPNEPEYLGYLGWTIYSNTELPLEERRERAKEHLHNAIEMSPNMDSTRVFLGKILKDEGLIEEAAYEFEVALLCNPKCREAERELQLHENGEW